MIAVKWLVSGSVGVLLLVNQDSFWFSVVVGSLINAFGVKVLKRLLKVPRPRQNVKFDPGMPSSHAHMLSYLATFALLNDLSRVSVLLYVFAVIVSFLRSRRGIHTIDQCAVGLCTGALGAYFWVVSAANTEINGMDEFLQTAESWKLRLFLVSCMFIGAGLLSVVGRMISGEAKHADEESD